jgi:acetyl-CoA C-acetyltransferase
MKAISMAAQSILAGDNDIVVAGGMENMSMVPHYFMARNATKLGDVKMVDGMVKDGLTDVYNQVHMGNCAEICAKERASLARIRMHFAIESYRRSAEAWKAGKFDNEIVPVEVPQRKGDAIISEDEEYKNVMLDKIAGLRPYLTKMVRLPQQMHLH